MKLKCLGELEEYEPVLQDPPEVEEDARVIYLEISTGEVGMPTRYDLGESLEG